MEKEIKELEDQRKQRLDFIEAQYYTPTLQAYKDNERYSWAVKTINDKFDAQINELREKQTNMQNLIELENQRLEWSLKNFPEATAHSSLVKAEGEIKEIMVDLAEGKRRPEEYADVLMCMFDSAGRQKEPITVKEIIQAFAAKLEKNKNRTWKKNPDNTYSHVK